jgi:antitoxin component YwqK of YwqJK toxin-antitoxin module
MASLVNGKLHGEEVVYDNAGNVIERNNWQNGRLPEE